MSDVISNTDTSDRLVVAVPSKGRLQENALEFFSRAGCAIRQSGSSREYTGRLAGVANADVAFLSASEIAGALGAGRVHLGITGEDLLAEKLSEPEKLVHIIKPLGFGHADVVVAVPQSWIDVRTMADFDDVAIAFHARRGERVRIATKYLRLTRTFFAEHGLADYRIVESAGATEGAPAGGTAEAIVDITSTGATLAANNLKILDDGVILRSEANLVASRGAQWGPNARAAASHLLEMIEGVSRARGVLEVRFLHDVSDAGLLEDLEHRFNARVPFPYDEDGARVALIMHVPEPALHDVVAHLYAAGKEAVTVTEPRYIFQRGNPLMSALEGKLG
ncbi:ATP phosphoribosyltransferase [Pyruvatibacter sp.]|uniref:ATP phosphoribosyltransferase n=1 Tax=Pyruvatibacter sp. TaxID=1981328 RepID=UPI0032EF75A2